LARKSDPLAVGRELRENLDAWVCREAARCPAGNRRGPDITRIGKGDFVAVYCREAQKFCPGHRRAGYEDQDNKKQQSRAD
jgi:hypothetical protein